MMLPRVPERDCLRFTRLCITLSYLNFISGFTIHSDPMTSIFLKSKSTLCLHFTSIVVMSRPQNLLTLLLVAGTGIGSGNHLLNAYLRLWR